MKMFLLWCEEFTLLPIRFHIICTSHIHTPCIKHCGEFAVVFSFKSEGCSYQKGENIQEFSSYFVWILTRKMNQKNKNDPFIISRVNERETRSFRIKKSVCLYFECKDFLFSDFMVFDFHFQPRWYSFF